VALTSPLAVSELRVVHPRNLLGVDDGELMVLLEIEEAALRAEFGVSGTTAEVNAGLRRAMIAGWPSFRIQVGQKASEDVGTDGYRTSFNRAGVVDFAWPAFVAAILAPVADAALVVEATAPTRGAISVPLDIRF
jgi:hypothetical protein